MEMICCFLIPGRWSLRFVSGQLPPGNWPNPKKPTLRVAAQKASSLMHGFWPRKCDVRQTVKIDRDQGWAFSRAALLYRLRNTADLLVGMNAIQLALRGKQDLAFSPPVTFVNRFYSSSNHPVRGAQLSFANNSKILTQTCSRFACKYVSPISSPPERGL